MKLALKAKSPIILLDPDQIKVRQVLAERHNTTIEHVVCGSGSDDLLDFLIRLVGPKTIVISTPTFGMYKFAF